VLQEPLPDGDADPVWQLVQTEPQPADLASIDAYFAFLKRSRPVPLSGPCGKVSESIAIRATPRSTSPAWLLSPSARHTPS
jgi:hypothetical protein